MKRTTSICHMAFTFNLLKSLKITFFKILKLTIFYHVHDPRVLIKHNFKNTKLN